MLGHLPLPTIHTQSHGQARRLRQGATGNTAHQSRTLLINTPRRWPIDAAKFAHDTFEMFLPGIYKSIAGLAEVIWGVQTQRRSQPWTKSPSARMHYRRKGHIVLIQECILLGIDVLKKFGAPDCQALCSSMRREDYWCVNIFKSGRSLLGMIAVIRVYQIQQYEAHGVLPVLERAKAMERAQQCPCLLDGFGQTNSYTCLSFFRPSINVEAVPSPC